MKFQEFCCWKSYILRSLMFYWKYRDAAVIESLFSTRTNQIFRKKNLFFRNITRLKYNET